MYSFCIYEKKQAKLDFKGPCPVIERQDIKLELAVCKNSMAKEIRTQDGTVFVFSKKKMRF